MWVERSMLVGSLVEAMVEDGFEELGDGGYQGNWSHVVYLVPVCAMFWYWYN